MAQVKRRLRAREMRALVARFAQSAMTVERFCRDEAISTSSFYRWRTLLSGGDRGVATRGTSSVAAGAADFVALGTLRPAHERMELRLELGDGVVLHLVRG